MIQKRIQCPKPWSDFGIWDIEGNVRVCCWSGITVGNINKNTIEEIWNGPLYQAIRHDVSCGVFSCNPHCPMLWGKEFISPYFGKGTPMSIPGTLPVDNAAVSNAVLSLEEMSRQKTVLRSKPRYFKLHIDNHCNLRCLMCRLDKSDPTEISERFLEELVGYYPYAEGLGIWGGEPLSSAASREFIFGFDYKSFAQCTIDVITNGTLLSRYMRELTQVRFGWVQISLDAASEDTYNNIRVNGSWSTALDGIRALLDLRHEQGRWFPITIDMVIQPANYQEIVSFVELGHTLGVRVTFGNLDVSSRWLFAQPDLLGKVRDEIQHGISRAIGYDMLSAGVSLSIIRDLIDGGNSQPAFV